MLNRMKMFGEQAKLEPGEVHCDRCGGKGYYSKYFGMGLTTDEDCEKCLETGKLDWVEIICGKGLNKC